MPIEKKGNQKRVLHSLKIQEISGVDFPAMEGAKAVLFKRAPNEDGEIEKSYEDPRLLSDEKGHAHILDLSEGPGGQTSFDSSTEAEYSHAHHWVLDKEGMPIIGAAEGHTHNVINKVLTAEQVKKHLAKGIDARKALKNKGEKIEKERSTMPNDEKKDQDVEKKDEKNEAFESLKGEVETLKSELAVAKAFGLLNDAERAHYAKLDETEQGLFLKLDGEGRALALEKVAGEDPVVYVSKRSGKEYRKSTSADVLDLVKQGDADWKIITEERSARRNEAFEKRATEILKSYPGEMPVKVALVKAIDGIKDESLKKQVGEVVAAGESALAKGFNRLGEGDGGSESDAEGKLDKMAKDKSEKENISFAKAYDAILKTKEGEALYAEIQREKKGK